MNPYIYEIATHGFVAMAAIGGTAIFYSRLLTSEKARTSAAKHTAENHLDDLCACRNAYDLLKQKNEQLLLELANSKQEMADRDSRIQNLKTRLDDADAHRISAVRKAYPVNTTKTVETQDELELYTTTDIAKFWKVSRATVGQWVKDGCPHTIAGAVTQGKNPRPRFKFDEVEAWLRNRTKRMRQQPLHPAA